MHFDVRAGEEMPFSGHTSASVNFEFKNPLFAFPSNDVADYDTGILLPESQLEIQPCLVDAMPSSHVRAELALRPLNGGTQSHLIMAQDGSLWVVKFRNNPQDVRILANEYIATRIAAALGLSVPECAVIEVEERLIARSPNLRIRLGQSKTEKCASGVQFGSRYVGGMMPGQVMDSLPDKDLKKIRNLDEFAGVLALDKWLGNCDHRQFVFSRNARQKRYEAVFIDQGHCFNAGEWNFIDHPSHGICRNPSVYENVTGWSSFEPWLSRIEQFNLDDILAIVSEVPVEWLGSGRATLGQLISKIYSRRLLVRDLIRQTKSSTKNPFPNWHPMNTGTGLSQRISTIAS